MPHLGKPFNPDYISTVTVTQGIKAWIVCFDGNYVQAFDTLEEFKEWIVNSTYLNKYRVVITCDVGFLRDD